MMPQTVQTYLQQLRDEPGRRRDSEAEAALGLLPKKTPVYQYENLAQMEAAAFAVGCGYYDNTCCVLLNVPERVVDEDREIMHFRKTTFYIKSKTLIAKMAKAPHEVAVGWFIAGLVEEVIQMGMRYQTHLKNMRSTWLENREPDYSIRPQRLPPEPW